MWVFIAEIWVWLNSSEAKSKLSLLGNVNREESATQLVHAFSTLLYTLAFLAVLGILGPCVSFSLDSKIFNFFFSRICCASCRIPIISSSSLSESLSYSPAACRSSSSSSNCSSFFKEIEQNVQKLYTTTEAIPQPFKPFLLINDQQVSILRSYFPNQNGGSMLDSTFRVSTRQAKQPFHSFIY